MAICMDGKVYIDLGGPDGNAFVLLAIASDILKQKGRQDEIPAIMQEAKSGDYHNLLTVLMREVGDFIVMVNVPGMYLDTVESTGVEIHD